MKRLIAVATLLFCTVAYAKSPAVEPKFKIKDQDAKGVPTFVSGELGKLAAGAPDRAAKEILRAHGALLQMTGTEDFDLVSSQRDGLGQSHIKLRQSLRGLPVVGAEYIVHADANGNVFAMNGRFAPDRDLPRNPTVNGWTALERSAAQAGITGAKWAAMKPELVYVVNEKSNAFLAWTAVAEYENEEGPQMDRVYADATSGDLVLRDSIIKRVRNRKTYNLNGGTSLPGTLVMSETSTTSSDSAIQAAHDYAGATYDYYFNVHGRDSYDGAGATITSSVHYSSAYNNAYWNGSQMVYGDGDGTQFIALSKALDVDAHELTHAVTERTAGLVYSNESGALNEATSDIMASAVEAWKRGYVDANTWKVGEDVYTPATAGDALRYMNDPAAAGDYDYYPTRYTGTSDNGGVHTNSGIANLAFYLMAKGGTHPRSKTTVVVPALNATATTSINMAAKIWYRALTVYMTSSTTFSAARTATTQAATDLYGAAAADSVTKAWDAVGAPGGSTGGGTTTLTNGQTVSSISASTGAWKYYKIAVPTGQASLKITMSGGTGDGDLYVKRGAQPTSASYDYRPYLSGNAESVSVTNPVAGDWYIGIYAYSSFSGVSLNATYAASTTPTCTSYSGSLTTVGANGYQPSSSGYVSSVSGSHTGKLTGPSGVDFDLYLEKWNGTSWASAASGTGSTATENVTYSGTSGTYRWRVNSYSGTGSYTLCTTKP